MKQSKIAPNTLQLNLSRELINSPSKALQMKTITIDNPRHNMFRTKKKKLLVKTNSIDGNTFMKPSLSIYNSVLQPQTSKTIQYRSKEDQVSFSDQKLVRVESIVEEKQNRLSQRQERIHNRIQQKEKNNIVLDTQYNDSLRYENEFIPLRNEAIHKKLHLPKHLIFKRSHIIKDFPNLKINKKINQNHRPRIYLSELMDYHDKDNNLLQNSLTLQNQRKISINNAKRSFMPTLTSHQIFK